MQILFEEEKASLLDQHKRDEKALADMEERLQVIRRREQELRDDHTTVSIYSRYNPYFSSNLYSLKLSFLITLSFLCVHNHIKTFLGCKRTYGE